MPYFSNSTIRTITRVADDAGIEPAVLLAVCEVESGGLAFAQIDDRKEPVIRFEGHYFDRRLHGSKREAARVSGLAHPKAGAVKNPRTQAGRWHLLTKARAIDDHAALESVSWGIGQVMGAHWKTLGYASVEHLVREARSGVAGQVRLMLRFIEHHGLEHLLKRRDWAGFARRYNGPGYARNAYDTKMAKAHARHLKATKQ
ncbi:MAG: N-acetylmuramidase family protein, partial [Pseudomonadota bacterium]